jgi:NAD(P)H-hydrate repair Nnr-like enzyme with NAD(P)H-hydrate dehydratase domain
VRGAAQRAAMKDFKDAAKSKGARQIGIFSRLLVDADALSLATPVSVVYAQYQIAAPHPSTFMFAT